MYGTLHRKNGKMLRRVKFQILGFWLYWYLLAMKRQHKTIVKLNADIKSIRQTERTKVANMIDQGIEHTVDKCGMTCEAHIIVDFIKKLKDVDGDE